MLRPTATAPSQVPGSLTRVAVTISGDESCRAACQARMFWRLHRLTGSQHRAPTDARRNPGTTRST